MLTAVKIVVNKPLKWICLGEGI